MTVNSAKKDLPYDSAEKLLDYFKVKKLNDKILTDIEKSCCNIFLKEMTEDVDKLKKEGASQNEINIRLQKRHKQYEILWSQIAEIKYHRIKE